MRATEEEIHAAMTAAFMAWVDLFPPAPPFPPGEETPIDAEKVALEERALVALRSLAASVLGWTLEEVVALEEEESKRFYASLEDAPPLPEGYIIHDDGPEPDDLT